MGSVLHARPRPKQPWLGLLLGLSFVLDFMRIILRFVLQLIAIVLISVMVFGGIVYLKVKPEYDSYMEEAEEIVQEADKDSFRYNEVTVMYDASGTQMTTLSKDSETVYLPYEEIHPDIVNAFVAVENRTFWEDPGVDWKSVARVVYDAVMSHGAEMHGASTITQQLARNVFLSSNVTLDRKLKEMAIAVKLTEKFSKKDIMEFYVNNIYFANGYYGIEAASRGYFDKPSSELTLSQIAYLCAIPNSPTFFDPFNDVERAVERRDHILQSMYDVGFIDKERLDTALSEKIVLAEHHASKNQYDVTYAMDCAVRYFMQKDGFVFHYHFDSTDDMRAYQGLYEEEYQRMRDELLQGGYRIYTSIDKELQTSLQNITDSFIEKTRTEELSDLQAAVVMMNENGKVTAVIGGTSDTTAFGLNRAYQSFRQPGSTIKPLIDYLPALMDGMTPDTVLKNIDVKKAIALEKERQKNGTPYSLAELDGKEVTMRYALEQSLNGVAYVLFDQVGAPEALSYLEKMRFANIVPEDYTMSTSLGGLTYGASPVEMTGAYGCLANGGMYSEPTCIVSIRDRHGKEMYRGDGPTRVYDPVAAEQLSDMMEGVMKTGTGSVLHWYDETDVPAYVKTGTTNDQKDVWMCGWTEPDEASKYVLSVWIGCDTPKTGVDAGLWGGATAGMLWKECMLERLGG